MCICMCDYTHCTTNDSFLLLHYHRNFLNLGADEDSEMRSEKTCFKIFGIGQQVSVFENKGKLVQMVAALLIKQHLLQVKVKNSTSSYRFSLDHTSSFLVHIELINYACDFCRN